MKRDMDLCREILRRVEALPDFSHGLLQIDGRSQAEVSYNVGLLHDAGFLRAMEIEVHGRAPAWLPLHLTWEGHEFLDTVRDDTLWNKVRGKVLHETGGLAMELVRSTALAYAKQLLMLPF